MGDGTKPLSEHAAQILNGFWEDSITPADLMARSLTAGQASAEAFRTASEGSAAAIRMGLSGTGLFVERTSGTWLQAFLPFVQIGETFGQIALTLANMSRALAETNFAQAEVVYQAEMEIQAARVQATALGQDPTPAVNAIIADAQAMVSTLSAKCVATLSGQPWAPGILDPRGIMPTGTGIGEFAAPDGESKSTQPQEFARPDSTSSQPPHTIAEATTPSGESTKPPSISVAGADGNQVAPISGSSGGGGGTPGGGLGSTPGGASPSGIGQGVSSPSSSLSQGGLGGTPSQATPGATQISPTSNVTSTGASPTDSLASGAQSPASSSASTPATTSSGSAVGTPTAQADAAPASAASNTTTTGTAATPFMAAGSAGAMTGGALAPAGAAAAPAASVGAAAPAAVPASAMSAAANAVQAAAAPAGAVPSVAAPASAMPQPAAAAPGPAVAPGQQIAGTMGAHPTVAPNAPAPSPSPSLQTSTSPVPPAQNQQSDSNESPSPIIDLAPLGVVPVVAWQDLADTPRQLTPEGKLVYNLLASILGSLRGGPHGPDSGLNWAVALLTRDDDAQLVLTTRDAGWLPPGAVIPPGTRVLWNVPTSVPWSTVDDPVRQVIEHARATGYAVDAVATTHPSRAYADHIGGGGLVEVTQPGPVLPDGASRLQAVASPDRLARLADMSEEQAARQTRALLRDLERITDSALLTDHSKTRTDIRRFLESRKEVPAALIDQLQRDLDAISDALATARTDPREVAIGQTAPASDRLRRLLLDQAVLNTVAAAVKHDVDSAVYSWTVARFLATRTSGFGPSGTVLTK